MTLSLAIEGSSFTARTCDEVAFFHNALFLIDDQGIIGDLVSPAPQLCPTTPRSTVRSLPVVVVLPAAR